MLGPRKRLTKDNGAVDPVVLLLPLYLSDIVSIRDLKTTLENFELGELSIADDIRLLGQGPIKNV